jgi:septal ring factor EnvC (AmiA/AmiB activator)
MDITGVNRSAILKNAASGTPGVAGGDSAADGPVSLQDMHDSLQNEEEKLSREIEDLKKRCFSIQEERKDLASKSKLPYLFAGGAAASFIGLMATSFIPLLPVGVALGATMMVMTIRQHKKEIDLDASLTKSAYELQHKDQERAKVQKKAHEIEQRIAQAETDVRALADSASTDASELVEVGDEFIVIDGVKLERKLKKFSLFR